MPSRLLLDEHMHVRVAHALSAKGHDVLIARRLSDNKCGDGIDDDAVLREAAKAKRAVVTLNRTDFIRLHQEQRGHHGILICRGIQAPRARDAHEELAKLLDQFLRAAGALAGQLFVMRKTPTGVEFVRWRDEDEGSLGS